MNASQHSRRGRRYTFLYFIAVSSCYDDIYAAAAVAAAEADTRLASDFSKYNLEIDDPTSEGGERCVDVNRTKATPRAIRRRHDMRQDQRRTFFTQKIAEDEVVSRAG